jgi:hypothetical protein
LGGSRTEPKLQSSKLTILDREADEVSLLNCSLSGFSGGTDHEIVGFQSPLLRSYRAVKPRTRQGRERAVIRLWLYNAPVKIRFLLSLVGLLVVLPALSCGPSKPDQQPKPPAPPAAALGPAGVRAGTIELHRWRDPAEQVVIEPSGVALGPEGEPLVHYLFVSRDRPEDLNLLVRSYAPFRMNAGRGRLAFGGKGTVAAGAVERRMILEWARLVAAETGGGKSSAAYGMAFAWHRGGAVGSCDDLAVYLTGEVRAGSCSWAEESRGRLAPEQLARVYAWFDSLAPFQFGGEEGVGSGREPSRLVFAGQGGTEPTAEAMAEIRGLASALHRELAGRRPGGAAAQQAQQLEAEAERSRAKKAGEPQAPAPAEVTPSGRLLLPPDTVAAGVPPAAIPPDLQPPPVPGAPPQAATSKSPPPAGHTSS